MPITPTPLEKQIINLDLAKGMDERTRPELNGNLTTIENLVQDQSGAWVKRGGSGDIKSSDASGTGTYPMTPMKIVPMVTGWGVVADFGRLLHKQDTQASFRARQYLMDFSVSSAAYVSSSGPQAQNAVNSADIRAVASNSTHDAVVFIRQITGATQHLKLTVAERSTGIEYAYDLNLVAFSGGGTPNNSVHMVMVADRYLHLYVTEGFLGVENHLHLVVIDTQSVMPTSESAITPILISSANLSLNDVVGGATYSYAVFTVAGVTNVRQYSATGTLTDSTTTANTYTGAGLDETNSRLWLIAADNANARMIALSSSGVSSISVATYLSTKPGTYVSPNTLTGGLLVVHAPTATFGAANIITTQVYTQPAGGGASVAVGAMYGWERVSKPFFSSITGKHYMHMAKGDVVSGTLTGEISQSAIVDLSTFTGFYRNNAGLALPYGSFRVACCLEPFGGLRRVLSSNLFRYSSTNQYEFYACVPYQTFRTTSGIGFYKLCIAHRGSLGSCSFGGATHIAHGGINSYDNRNLVENSFVDSPLAVKATPAATPGLLAGSYRYYVIYRHTNANGANAISRVYGPITSVNVAASTGQNSFTIQPWSVTNRDSGKADSLPVVEVFRTKTGGTQFYLCASSRDSGPSGSVDGNVQSIVQDATSGLFTFTDNISDTLLGVNAIMYRQPGTTNSAADRYPAPACTFVVQHKDRLFCADPYGQRVYYSSFFVDGEEPWFNPTFNFFVHAGSGPITALASMDGRLFIFKRDAIFVVDGDGPGEAGPTGNEFSPPQSLASVYGCIDHRSLVVTPKGILYRSVRGIEMLTRSLQVDWVGERVDTTVDANPITTGSCIDSSSRVHWTLSVSETAAGVYGVNGVELVYDMSCDAWSVHRYTGTDGTYGHALGCISNVFDAGTNKVVVGFGYSGVAPISTASYLDSLGYYTPFKIESGWMKQGPQARQRVTDLLFLAKKAATSNHAIKISIAYNYSDTYTQTHTFEPDVINALTIEELELQPSTQQVLSIRVKIEDQAPADTVTYPIGLGAGCDILAVSAEVAAKPGAPKLAAGQKA